MKQVVNNAIDVRTLDKLKFIKANIRVLKRKKQIEAANDFFEMVIKGKPLSANQLSFIEGIYENTFKGLGFDSCQVKHDPKRKAFELY